MDAGTIFVVEPDRTIRGMYEHTLRSDGFQTKGFERMSDALQAIHDLQCEVGLVHFDQRRESIPEVLSGWMEMSRDASVIVIATDPSPQDVVSMFRAGAADVLIHPHETTELLSCVRSALLRRNERLQPGQQERLRVASRMAAGVVHHLNNLLERIVGRISLLLARSDVLPDVHRELRESLEDSREIASFVRRMSYLSHTATIQTAEILPVQIIQETLQALLERKGTRTKLVCEFERNVSVMGDRRLLSELLEELLANAREASPTERPVVVRLQSEETVRSTVLAIRIEDEGPGLTAWQMKHLFEPFFSTKSQNGRGLGLVVASEIAKRLGGSLEVQNRSPHGVVATVRLPVCEEKSSRVQPPALGSDAPLDGAVMVIDDMEPVLIMIGRMIVKITGREVLRVTNGSDALRILHRPGMHLSLILLDLSLEDESGIDVYYQIRKINQDVPILFISGYTSDAGLQTVLDADHKTRFLPKPFELGQLRKAILSLLQEP